MALKGANSRNRIVKFEEFPNLLAAVVEPGRRNELVD